MLEQLETGAPYPFNEPDPPPYAPGAWRAEEVARLRRDIAYHEEHAAKDKEQAEKATAWVQALAASLENT